MAGKLTIGPRERAMLIILGIVAALGVAYLLFFSGGETPPTDTGTPFVPGQRTPTPSVTAQPSAPPDTDEVFEGKDPFKPLIDAGAPGGGGTPPPGGGTPTPGATGGTRTGTRVELLDIFTTDGVRFASVRVSGETHNVKEGDTFAGNYRVVSLTDECGTFVLGDERFTLCIGQDVFK